jgi:mono/diheme cytochrome c family protein
MPENYGKLFCGILLAALSLTAQSQGWQVPQPSAGLMPNPASGKKLFLQHCAACHGADLMGVAQAAKRRGRPCCIKSMSHPITGMRPFNWP